MSSVTLTEDGGLLVAEPEAIWQRETTLHITLISSLKKINKY